jgi:hypothetical protein
VDNNVRIKVVPASGTRWSLRLIFDLLMQNGEGSGYRSGDARVVVENAEGREIVLDWTTTTEEAQEMADQAYVDLAALGLPAWCEKYHLRPDWVEGK